MISGYRHSTYAHSMAEFGRPRYLPNSKGWILERPIPGTPYRDAMGCYPLFSCLDWDGLMADIEEIGQELVSLTIVPAPFDAYDLELLESCFDHVHHFKDHFVLDLSQPINSIVKRSHRAAVRRALKVVEVRLCQEPDSYLDIWMELFGVLIKRHKITGLRAFSRASFAKQLAVPGLKMFEVTVENQTVGLDLWYIQDDVAYGHLVAFNELGYQTRASYASKWFILQFFADKVKWVDLGGGAGSSTNGSDGLSIYKQGWATGTQPVFICGQILQPEIYHQLTHQRQSESTNYFPAYRHGEFG